MKTTLITFITGFMLINLSTFAQITVNGDLSESQYITMATKQNSNAGFGSGIDVSKIVYYPDFTNGILYLGVEGKLNTTNSDGIGIWINISGSGAPTGASAGTSLGFSGGGHYMGGNGMTNPNFKADFEVDYMFAMNTGGNATNCYVDAGSRVGTPAGVYLGDCGQSGTAVDYTTTGTVFSSGHTITFAFNNAGTSNKGFEIKIPFDAIGATAAMNISAFAFVVSSTAFFSDVTVPGNRTGGNPGFDPDFSLFTGGPYNSSTYPLPVELSSFTASVIDNNVQLLWSTATEMNNYGFEIQRQVILRQTQVGKWETIGFVSGSGNSNSPKSYSFIDKNTLEGKIYYRLKQIDNDGKFNYSNIVEVDFNSLLPGEFALYQNYPNPFNPSTVISYQLSVNSFVNLKVYDFLGNEITTLVNEYQPEGKYYLTFNAQNLSSGVYYYKLTVGDNSVVKKMTVIK